MAMKTCVVIIGRSSRRIRDHGRKSMAAIGGPMQVDGRKSTSDSSQSKISLSHDFLRRCPWLYEPA